jgi:hypothetical protein
VTDVESRKELEAQIARDRRELSQTLEVLGDRVRAELDLKQKVRERPSAWLTGAFFFGLWMGARR